jgi:tRNA-splicing ligase RtcB
MGRKEAGRRLDQKTVDAEMDANDILSNCRRYLIDESPDACKNFAEVLKSVERAGPAKPVATLKARFVIKDNDKADD